MEKQIFGVLLLIFISGCGCATLQANELELTQKVKDYNIGDQSVLYVYIADTNNLANAKKAIFFPHVDSFSRLEIKNSFMNFSNLVRVNNTDNTTLQRYIYRTSSDTTYVWVEFGGKTLNLTTMPKRYAKGEYILASYSVVVQMNKGEPVAITWDDGCNECMKTNNETDPEQCIDNSCGVTILECLVCESCVQNDTFWQTCNIKIYLGFIGTDALSRPLTSAGNMPSNFAKFSLVPLFRSAAGTITQQLTSQNTSEAYDPRFDPNVNDPQWNIEQ
jgi:hypothetical protein